MGHKIGELLPSSGLMRKSGIYAGLLAVLLLAIGLLGAGGDSAEGEKSPVDLVVLYDLGGKFDKSFNEAAYNGAQQFFREFKVSYKDFEPTSETQYEQALRRYARRGFDSIVAVGLGWAVSVRNVASEFPHINFTVIDADVSLPNVRVVKFKEHEGSFLAGVAAAMHSKSGQIGFMGGMDIPLIRRFERGYLEGAQYVQPDIRLVSNYVGSTPAAWNDPIKAADLARGQYSRGVDVIYHAAGPSGLGVIQAAKDSRNFAIGVDSNQNGVAPGYVLTSMVKRVDRAVYEAFKDTLNGQWQAGEQVLGLAELGVDLAIDDNNQALITKDMQARIDAARGQITSGEIVVADVDGANSSN